jgi:hypothetical protein
VRNEEIDMLITILPKFTVTMNHSPRAKTDEIAEEELQERTKKSYPLVNKWKHNGGMLLRSPSRL